MTNTTTAADWRTDAPPAAGWFNASTERCADIRRYWTGAAWSDPCYADDPQRYFDQARVRVADTEGCAVEWREAPTA